MSLIVKEITQHADRESAFMIREKVFIEEQQVARDLEFEFEEESRAYLAMMDASPVGTARWRKTTEGVKLERFAVLQPYRRKGVASALLERILEDLQPEPYIYLHAQVSATALYAAFGFERIGDPFWEANIEHYKMFLEK